MKARNITIAVCSICFLFVLFSRCKKSTDKITGTTGIDTCSNIVDVNMDSSAFALPTAFTPNGDGVDDVYRAYASRPDSISNYSLSVYKSDGTMVFQTDSLNGAWDGYVSGVLDTDYRYEVQVSLTMHSGATLDTCSYLFSLTTSAAGCINIHPADTAKYLFADQIDIATGHYSFPNQERYCN